MKKYTLNKSITGELLRRFEDYYDYFFTPNLEGEQAEKFTKELLGVDLNPEIMKYNVSIIYNQLNDKQREAIKNESFKDFKEDYVRDIRNGVINKCVDVVLEEYYDKEEKLKTLLEIIDMQDLMLGILNLEQIVDIINGRKVDKYIQEIINQGPSDENLKKVCIDVQKDLAARDFINDVKEGEFFLSCFNIYQKRLKEEYIK